MSQEEHRGELVIRTLAMPKDTNANGDIFGGWLVSQMDLGGAILAKKVSHSRVVTAAIDQMSFLRPVNVGDTVCCYADLLETGRTSMKILIQAWSVPYNSDERGKVTEGVFTFVAIDEDGKPRPVGPK
ncbi:MAG: acyl-CoA thioester hydrolase YciA [Legionellales bacterium]|nr:acyl-CoA thioester hydrolase YciA [Legionellales bacterium]|tara:strand:- start:73 stop:456 length:384 start_codon:yes stop_codon:yes gene_type:complete